MSVKGFVFLAIAVMATAGLAGPAAALKGDREHARIIILDQCVEGSAKRGNEFSEFADKCRCGTDKTIRKLSDDEVAEVVAAGKLRGSASKVWNEQMKLCK